MMAVSQWRGYKLSLGEDKLNFFCKSHVLIATFDFS